MAGEAASRSGKVDQDDEFGACIAGGRAPGSWGIFARAYLTAAGG